MIEGRDLRAHRRWTARPRSASPRFSTDAKRARPSAISPAACRSSRVGRRGDPRATRPAALHVGASRRARAVRLARSSARARLAGAPLGTVCRCATRAPATTSSRSSIRSRCARRPSTACSTTASAWSNRWPSSGASARRGRCSSTAASAAPSRSRGRALAVGVVKSHRTLYARGDALDDGARARGSASGRACSWSRRKSGERVASWYLRLRDPRGHDPMWGLVRVEIAMPGSDDIGARADEVSRWILAEAQPVALPDSRWDKMVYGVRDCEEFLRAVM